VWGDPVDVILDYARAHDIGLIICGTHGRRGLDRLAMGSVAERLLRHAACPVLMVHGTPHELGQHLTPQCAPAADALADIRQC
jgi:K+-sensing histidine kinase KdpD